MDIEKILGLIFSNELFTGWILAGAGAIFAWIWKRVKVKDERLQKALAFLEEGVDETWEEYVKALKDGAKDGKLTAAERKAALNMAIEKAKVFAKAEGWDILKYISASVLPMIIKKLVGDRKLPPA